MTIPRAMSIALAVLVVVAAHAAADESARDVIVPAMSRPDYAAYCAAVGMSRDQHTIADFVFSDYATTLEDLVDRSDEQAEAAGRSSIRRALSGKMRMAPQELRERRIEVLEAYATALPEASSALDKLLIDLRQILLEEQRPAAAIAERELRRRLLLHPRQAERLDQAYAGDGIDLLQLVADAQRRGGELETLRADLIAALASDYEMLLDSLLADSALDWNDGRLRVRMARISRDPDAILLEEQRGLARWSRLDELNRRTAEQVGRIAATELGPRAQLRWRDRFDRASFPWLLGRDVVDRQLDWIRRNEGDDETIRAAEIVHAEYDGQRRRLARQAIEIIRRGRVELRAVLYPMMEPVDPGDSARRELYEQLLRNSGEQTSHESDARGRLEALVDDSIRARMRRETSAGGRGR